MIILTMYYKSEGGGYFIRLCRLITACAQHGHSVHYLSPRPFSKLPDTPNIFWHKAWVFGPECLQMLQCLLILPIQVFAISMKYHVDQIVPFGSAYAAVSAPTYLILKTPVTTFLRGSWLRELQYRKSMRLILLAARLMDRIGLTLSSLLVPNSEALSTALKAQGIDASKIRVLPNDLTLPDRLDKAQAKRVLCERHALPVDHFLIAYVGTFKALKRVWMTVDILNAMKGAKATLIIAGDGADKARISQRIRALGLEPQCRMIGWADDPRPIYEAADLTILPSEFEGSPNAVLESLAYDTPVLGARSPGIEEMLPNEMLFDPATIPETANRIRCLMKDPAAQKMMFTALQQTRAQYIFDWDVRVVEILTHVIPEKPLR